ncbi:energy-coupling factor ABC transporter ATP-binding protein [Blastococcus sp. Marseille-P5729]|uniref:energy-coupling factor ABC transporter ATP-binding protein n=1 Tax=Blastococcus sp. Marseille-P5729 TaxID=2086582 RepID=UPI000D108C17|nr:ATP-binding cassette domain-containing protein [Blastococcus sp. Marseille-P5729]
MTPADDAMLLAAESVRAGYRGAPDVLHDASVQVMRGVRLAVMGANGSGKTTLLRCLSGAHEPASGTVISRGTPLRYKQSAMNTHRQHVQLVLQDPDDQLFSADVRADVSFGPINLGLPDAAVLARVREALDLLGIADLADRAVHQLSYGQRKRVAIAGAIAMRPSVLLLDEPSAGLDPTTVHQLYGVLRRLEDAGTTVVLATHDVDLAWRWADEVAVVHAGVVQQGPVADVLTDDALLDAARLQLPWQVDLLRRAGIAFDAANRPRSPADIADLIRDGSARGDDVLGDPG